MARWLKISSRVSLLLLLVWCIFSMSYSHTLAYQIPRQVLNGGGAMWLSTTSYKLSSSLGQSITGVQATADTILYTGFWNPWVVQTTPVEWEEEDFSQLPKEFDLRQNYPNPFNPTTIIEYALPKVSQVKIRIYNILGQKVRNLVDEPQEPGYKTIHWDGKDDGGNEVSSGVYFYRIEAGDFVKCKKMTLLK
ncbi:MAG: T9SS type A sorting domain-containing protein [candidate division Zixibacteria bacterium]|nr:T9SS type A sorting domain-containing protein [candidate division Zixibacteria bacterium]